ncbi:MAG TPA: NAD-dependent protein deacetylase [Polyangiaceae bacterium]|nr:NAD-dependent protein deacetylase [Polyangiaceae bacterium]
MIDRLCELVHGRSVVALTGAGLSTDSGIPDYRSPQALAKPRRPIHGPEFVRSEATRRRYWARAALGWERMRAAEPNAGHRALADLERAGVVVHVITQNVDRLHRKGGSQNVTELHGALAEVRCLDCGALEDRDALQERMLALNPGWVEADAPIAPDGDAELPADRVARFVVPPCARCGGVLKPAVVFFGDNVPRAIVDEAYEATDAAEVLLVVGTSLAVYSGYRFLRRAVERRTPVVIVNRGPVRGEEHATLKVEGGAGETLAGLSRAVRARG